MIYISNNTIVPHLAAAAGAITRHSTSGVTVTLIAGIIRVASVAIESVAWCTLLTVDTSCVIPAVLKDLKVLRNGSYCH